MSIWAYWLALGAGDAVGVAWALADADGAIDSVDALGAALLGAALLGSAVGTRGTDVVGVAAGEHAAAPNARTAPTPVVIRQR